MWIFYFLGVGKSWPMNIGGKPNFTFYHNFPSFVPIMFELTVFFAAHLMVITFYMRSKLWPFKKPENPNPLTTDDKFLIVVLTAHIFQHMLRQNYAFHQQLLEVFFFYFL